MSARGNEQGSASTRWNRPIRVLGVVGGGPRALAALLALDAELAAGSAADSLPPLEVHLFEPGAPGAGRVWRVEQPEHLLLNVTPDIVDMTSTTVPLSYRQWEAEQGLPRVDWPPRARVGEYLAWAFMRLLHSPRLRITHRRERVQAVLATSAGEWMLRADSGDLTVDRVLVCTGHHGSIGPDHEALTKGSDRSPITVRGAALTALDVALDLTAGRGGTWASADGARSGLVHTPGETEPERIVLTSRCGELLAPKPEVDLTAIRAAVTAVTGELSGRATPDDRWWSVLVRAAQAAAAVSGVRVRTDDLQAALDAPRTSGTDVWDRLATDLARGEGRWDDDAAWWLGRAWSAGYADVIGSLARAPRDPRLWKRWRDRAARLERTAFGPPAPTARRLLALHDAGILTLAGSAAYDTQTPGSRVDAVTDPPGVLDSSGSPGTGVWEGLLAGGHAHVRLGERGVFTAPDGTCLRADGRPSHGLAALGRPTEDPVIGHDTLSRTLHGDVDRWAAAVAAAFTTHATPAPQ